MSVELDCSGSLEERDLRDAFVRQCSEASKAPIFAPAVCSSWLSLFPIVVSLISFALRVSVSLPFVSLFLFFHWFVFVLFSVLWLMYRFPITFFVRFVLFF